LIQKARAVELVKRFHKLKKKLAGLNNICIFAPNTPQMKKLICIEALRYDCLWWANFVGLLALNTPHQWKIENSLNFIVVIGI
jgi:hypothetical protein